MQLVQYKITVIFVSRTVKCALKNRTKILYNMLLKNMQTYAK